MVPVTVAPLLSVRSTTPRSYRRSVSWRSRRSSTLTERRAPPDAPRGYPDDARGALDDRDDPEQPVGHRFGINPQFRHLRGLPGQTSTDPSTGRPIRGPA